MFTVSGVEEGVVVPMRFMWTCMSRKVWRVLGLIFDFYFIIHLLQCLVFLVSFFHQRFSC